MRSCFRLSLVVLAWIALGLLASARPAGALTYLSEEEALALSFGEGAQIQKQTFELSEEGRARYAEALGAEPAPGAAYEIIMARREEKLLGYALVLTEASRYRPITFLVAVTPSGEVGRVDIMVYREPRGGEVRKERFLEQYEGKSGSVQLGRDILSISGATVSAQVMTYGVNKALFLVRELFLREPPPSSSSEEPAAQKAQAAQPPKKEGA